MPVTPWNPATTVSRGNVRVGIVPTVTSMSAPTLAQINAGIGIECAITDFNGTSSSSSESIDWLCSPTSEQLPGSITHAVDDLTIKVTGQADSSLYTALAPGTTIYLWRRDGIPVATVPVAAQMIWLWKVVVTSVDPAPASNNYVAVVVHVNVLDRVAQPVAIAA